MNKNYYAILGVNAIASEKEIRAAYINLSIKYHPDKNIGNEKTAEEKFKEIAEAYQVLGNPIKKLLYDSEINSIGTNCNVCNGTGFINVVYTAFIQREGKKPCPFCNQ